MGAIAYAYLLTPDFSLYQRSGRADQGFEGTYTIASVGTDREAIGLEGDRTLQL